MINEKELVDRALKEGHEIADKIQVAKSLSEIENLSERIEQYFDFVNENFGILTDYDEKDCEITAFLDVALDWKRTMLLPENHDNQSVISLYENYMKQYLDFLDSKRWIEESYGVKLK